MIDLLVVSTASVTAINRNVYIEMIKLGWAVEMVIPSTYPLADGNVLVAEKKRDTDPTIHFLKLSGSNPRTFYFQKTAELLNARKPKVILIESDPVSTMAVRIGQLCRNRKIILFSLSCENLSFDVWPTLLRKGISSLPSSLVKKTLYLLAKRNINTVFTISGDGTALFKGKGYQNVIKIPLGFDSSIFFPNPDKRQSLVKELNIKSDTIAYFGRVIEEKGVHLLVQALGRLKDLKWNFMLDKFSHSITRYQKTIDDLIKQQGLCERVIYIEANHTEVADYMNTADIIVMPSISTPKWKEQYGRVAPEAMACGVLVIASDSGALPELISDGGVVVKEGDIAALEAALRLHLTDVTLRQDIQTRAVNRAHQFLTIKNQAKFYGDRLTKLGLTPNGAN